MIPDETTIRRFFSALALPVYELVRIHPINLTRHGRPVTEGALYDNLSTLVDDAAGFNSEWNIYTRINGFKPNRPVANSFDQGKVFEREANRTKTKGKGGHLIGNTAVVRRRHIFIDADVVRPKDRNSSDAQREMAIERVQEIAAHLVSRGFPAGLIGMSGNGGYLLLKCDLPVTENKYIEVLTQELSRQFSDEHIEIDPCVFDLARLMRVLGTVNRKCPGTDGYPQGLSQIFSLPEPFSPVPIGAIQNITGLIESQEKKAKPPVAGEHEARVEYCENQLTAAGITFDTVAREDSTILRFDGKCPFPHDDDAGGGPALIIWRSDNNVVYDCKQSRCGKHLADLEKHLGTILIPVSRGVLDPMTIAAQHREKFGPFIFFHGHLHQYQHDAWHETDKTDQDPFVIQSIDRIIVDLASRTRSRRAMKFPVDVAGSAFRALQSLVAHPIPRDQVPPFFVVAHPWEALDVLPVKNGLLNLREFVTGGEHFIPPTPDYFSVHQSQVTYDPSAKADRWFKFLESLEFEPGRRDLLQEVMGSSLWLGWRLQKLYLLAGAPRGGKGTVAQIERYLLGGALACSSPSLTDFDLSENKFGLEASIGKRLSVIREMTFPTRGVDEIVSNLKAWTGADAIQVNRKGIVHVQTTFDTKLWGMTNHIVALPDSSGALQARIIPLVFQVSFVGREDTDLLRQLQDEASGILNWALEGLKRLWANRGQFTVPESTASLLKSLRIGGAPVEAYLMECCVLDPTQCVQKKSLHADFCEWSGLDMSLRQFSDDLIAASAMRVKSGRTTGHGGVPRGYTVAKMASDVEGQVHLFLGISPKGQEKSSTETSATKSE